VLALYHTSRFLRKQGAVFASTAILSGSLLYKVSYMPEDKCKLIIASLLNPLLAAWTLFQARLRHLTARVPPLLG
jgi:hypothetical protein